MLYTEYDNPKELKQLGQDAVKAQYRSSSYDEHNVFQCFSSANKVMQTVSTMWMFC